MPNENPNATPQPTVPPTPSGAAPTEQARVPAGNTDGGQFVNPLEYRYKESDGVESYLVGKTAREAAKMVEGYYKLGPQNTAPAQTQTNYGYQPPPQQTQTSGRPTQDEWAINPHDAAQRDWQWRQQNEIAPVVNQSFQNNAYTVRAIGEMRHADAFKRYGPEIDIMIRQIPPQQMTPQALDMAVDIVRGRHAHEYAEELATQKAERLIEARIAAGSMVRPDSNGAGPIAPNGPAYTAEDMPGWWKDSMTKANLDPRKIDEFLQTTKYYGVENGKVNLTKAREQYIEAIKRRQVVHE